MKIIRHLYTNGETTVSTVSKADAENILLENLEFRFN